MFLCLGLIGCDQLANPYSEEAFKQATSLKAQSLVLIASGNEPFLANEEEANALLLEFAKAYEFARGRGQTTSDEAAAQWAIVLDPNGGSVGEFIAQWREKGRMSEFFVSEFASTVSMQFDAIIELETGRKITLE